jgi:ssDNA-specific exonuclease RecJ
MAEKEEKKELAKVEPSIKVLSPAEQAEGDKRFNERVDALIAEEKNLTKSVLYHHWRKGQFANEIKTTPEKYGNHTIADLRDAFKTGESTLHSWHLFYIKYDSEKKVEELADRGANWRDVRGVLTLEDEKTRDELLQKRITNVLDSEDLLEQVKKINAKNREANKAKKKTAKKKTASEKAQAKAAERVLNTVRQANGILLTMASTMDDFKEAYDEFYLLEEGKTKSDIQAALQDSFKNVSILHKKLAFILEHREKVLAKRKAANEAAKKV